VAAASSPTRRRATTPERVLAAALELFTEQGLVATSIEEICQRSGASVGSVYHHFASKEGIAAALYLDGLADYQRAFADELREHDDPRAGVQAAVRLHLDWCERNPQVTRLLLAAGDTARQHAAAELRELNQSFFAEVGGWYGPHARYGVLRELDFDLVHALWLGPAQELSRLWLSGRSAVNPRRAGRVLAEGAWQALRAKGVSK
jgi:AcrR family transcriptional regulator